MGYFELAVGLLFLLALLDLSVGVSNDAVNFLNSAIGSRVTTRRNILIVAGLGVLAGSLFSSGIMEVARRGIFNPEMFVFADVMIIFLAVMLADVLLLDLFNTFGLPTSTTVSIVFELLGAAVAVALFAVIGDPNGSDVVDYVNVQNALLIISGIGLSVVVAFIAGTVIQFFSRMLFTFQQRNHSVALRVGWSAVAFTAISYFLLLKGLKGVSFVADTTHQLIYDNMLEFTLGLLGVWLVVMWLLDRIRVDILAVVVLGGTFSLALAFASNDLVNFIGVPLAGLSSWQAWTGSGLPADAMTMEALTEPVQGNTLILLAAGGVMVVTLWLSSKARSVTHTEVSLGRQDEGAERFRPGPVSRGIVRTFVTSGETAGRAIPKQWRTGLAERFRREREHSFDLDRPAFDKVRASVNLTVASILIVFATSLKLPLSTTFVSFMVAMGTSLADRAWGRDSAAYRLAGVFSVVGGWFVTAAAAFLMAAAFAALIKTIGGYAIIMLVVLAAVALVRTHRYHDKQSKMHDLMLDSTGLQLDEHALELRQHFTAAMQHNAEIVDKTLKVLVTRKRKRVRKLMAELKADASATSETEKEFVRRLNRVQPKVESWLLRQIEVLGCEREMLQSSSMLVDLAAEHVLNEHSPPSEGVAASLGTLRGLFADAFSGLGVDSDDTVERPVRRPRQEIDRELDRLTGLILDDLYSGERSTTNSSLMIGIVQELRDVNRELRRAATW